MKVTRLNLVTCDMILDLASETSETSSRHMEKYLGLQQRIKKVSIHSGTCLPSV